MSSDFAPICQTADYPILEVVPTLVNVYEGFNITEIASETISYGVYKQPISTVVTKIINDTTNDNTTNVRYLLNASCSTDKNVWYYKETLEG